MRTGRSYVATAVALGIISLTGCTTSHVDDGAPAPGEDWGDENKYPNIGGAFHSLDALTGTCTFANGLVTVTSTAAQTIIIGKRAVDSAILVNGAECKTVATATVPATAATATTMKRLVVTGGANNEALILDLLGGLFAPGVSSATAGGISVDLGGGTNALNIRGTSAADTFFLGSDGIAFNADNYKDLTFANVASLNIALAGGNDALTATNATPTKGITGNASIALTVFGGAGNDTIVGGAKADTIWGGPGNDTLGGGIGTGSDGADTLYGEDGADTFNMGTVADGNDTIDCGDESPNTSVDMVSYAGRTAVITATMATNVASPDGGGGGGGDAGAGSPTGTAGESGEADSIAYNCEGIAGGSKNDVLVGNELANVLTGNDGDDQLTGGDGDDVLNGGKGKDTFLEGSADNDSDVFNGGDDEDTVDYSGRTGDLTVTMDGTAANDGLDNEEDNVKADVENLIAGTGNDDITGNGLNNKLTGGDGDDTLSGGTGDDRFLEGAADSGSDVFNGGGGVDTVDYSERTTALLVTMDGENADDGLTASGGEGDNVKADVENLIGGDGNDDITGNDGNNQIEGGDGDDTIDGGEGDDQLDGSDSGAGVDNDITCGGGTDVAINKGDDGSYAVDCELKGN